MASQGLLNEELGARVRTLLLDYEALLAVAAVQRVPALPRSLVETAGFGALAILLESPMEVLLVRGSRSGEGRDGRVPRERPAGPAGLANTADSPPLPSHHRSAFASVGPHVGASRRGERRHAGVA